MAITRKMLQDSMVVSCRRDNPSACPQTNSNKFTTSQAPSSTFLGESRHDYKRHQRCIGHVDWRCFGNVCGVQLFVVSSNMESERIGIASWLDVREDKRNERLRNVFHFLIRFIIYVAAMAVFVHTRHFACDSPCR